MNITSEDEALLELFENGKTSDKKYKRLPIAAIKGYVKAVNKMRAATRIEDIMRDHGLRYERLHGDRKDQESVRCNDVWRLIFPSNPQLSPSMSFLRVHVLSLLNYHIN